MYYYSNVEQIWRTINNAVRKDNELLKLIQLSEKFDCNQ